MIVRPLRMVSAVALLFLSNLAGADEVEIRLLVKQLDSPAFAQRQKATQQLQALGKAAFPALQKASQSSSREVAARSIRILKHHLDNGDQKTKSAAKKVLEHLSEASEGRAAQMAKKALQPKLDQTKIFLPEGKKQFMPGILPGMNAPGIAGKVRRVSIRVSNGTKYIDVEEDGRKISIHKAANGSIQIELTEKKNGKEQTKKYKADSADQLKKKHPDAYKIYQKMGQG